MKQNMSLMHPTTLTAVKHGEKSKLATRVVTIVFGLFAVVVVGVLATRVSNGASRGSTSREALEAHGAVVADTCAATLPIGSTIKFKSRVTAAGYLFACTSNHEYIYAKSGPMDSTFQFKVVAPKNNGLCSYSFESVAVPGKYLGFYSTGSHMYLQTHVNHPELISFQVKAGLMGSGLSFMNVAGSYNAVKGNTAWGSTTCGTTDRVESFWVHPNSLPAQTDQLAKEMSWDVVVIDGGSCNSHTTCETGSSCVGGICKVALDAIRAQQTADGFTEILHCGYSASGAHFWHNKNGGTSSLVTKLKTQMVAVRFIDGQGKQVSMKTLAAPGSANSLAAADKMFNLNVPSSGFNGVWSSANFEGDPALMDTLKFSCPTGSGTTPLSNGMVYWACGNHGGLHVHPGMCTWRYSVRTNQDFLMFIKPITSCS